MPEPLFDERFQLRQRERADKTPCRLYTEAAARLRDRLDDLKEPPPGLVTSCLALQQENDLPGALQKIYKSLPSGGLFSGVLAGGESLRELRLCLTEAEIALKGGASPRVAPMIQLEALSRLLPEIGFALPVADRERLTLVYPNLNALMKDLRTAGWTNSLTARARRFAPRALFERAAELYAEHFPGPKGQGLFVTVDLLFLHGWRE